MKISCFPFKLPMKAKRLSLLFSIGYAVLCANAASSTDFHAATICNGAARLNNGSLVCIGQPFVGMTGSEPSSISIGVGAIPAVAQNKSGFAPGTWHLSALAHDGGFSLLLPSRPGNAYVIQASTNLSDWLPIWSNTADSWSILFVDPDRSNHPFRFYRSTAQ